MPINLIRWQFIYVRSGSIESRMVREKDFHPSHEMNIIKWWGECQVPEPRGWSLESISQLESEG